ncbi:MAG: cyclic nucleotide-binding domain-containing protein [Actinobacteria bacterium]|nr:cyclic nucleotide-binding domain-containing protein [Actinomycetota bacterium]
MPSPSPELLARVPLFADLEKKELERLAKSFRERTFKPGSPIATAGTGGVGFFVISEGEATVSVGGREVAKLKSGDHFGEVALIDENHSRSADVTAESNLVTYGLTAWEFKPIVESSPSIAWKLLQSLAAKLRDAEARAGASYS